MSYSPDSLPAVTAVDIYDLRGIVSTVWWPIGEYMDNPANRPAAHFEKENAEAIATLWRQLPPRMSYRCHHPPFALQFWKGEESLCRASICWHCNNLGGDSQGDPIGYSFDGSSPISQRLLGQLKRAAREGKCRTTPCPTKQAISGLSDDEASFMHITAFDYERIWTNPLYKRLLPPEILATIRPFWFWDDNTARIRRYASRLEQSGSPSDIPGLLPADFSSLARFEASEAEDSDGARVWLKARLPDANPTVFVSWTDTEAALMDWQTFCDYWDTLCWSRSDDVFVWPAGEEWALVYWYEGVLEFGVKK